MLSALVTQLATTLLSSRSSAKYVVDLCIVTQLASTLLFSRSISNYIVDFCKATCNYVVIFFLSYAGTIDAAWSALKKQFVPPKPRFTVVRKILAMDVRKPQCQRAAEDD